MHATAITEVGTVGIPVVDQDRALEFYVDTLGFESAGTFPSQVRAGSRWPRRELRPLSR